MIAAFVADSHYDEGCRLDECVRVHDWIAQDAAARSVDLVVHTGDVFERRSTPIERQHAFRWFQRMADIAPVVVVRGNHDETGNLPLLERLQAKHPIWVVESVAGIVIETKAGPVAVGALGWPQRSNIAKFAAIANHDAVELAAADALRSVFRYLGTVFDALDPSIPRVLAAHAMVRASRVSTGQPLCGCDFEIGVEDLALARADIYALGHVHLGQEWLTPDGKPVVYPGSPRRTNFGELEKKSYLIAEFSPVVARQRAQLRAELATLPTDSDSPGRSEEETRLRQSLAKLALCTWERVETPATPMLLLEAEWGYSELAGRDGWLSGPDESALESVRGAEVKLRYRVPASKREAAALAAEAGVAKMIASGAVSVVVEPEVIVEQRARAPEVSRATTLPDKLEALWGAKGFDPGDRREPLLAKLADIESQTL